MFTKTKEQPNKKTLRTCSSLQTKKKIVGPCHTVPDQNQKLHCHRTLSSLSSHSFHSWLMNL